jgi:uncharacterized membrane protein YbhN (UPF0104 family)
VAIAARVRRLIAALLRHGLLSAFRSLRPVDALVMVAARAAFIVQYVLMTWMFLRTFDFHVPFGKILVYNPILGLIGFLPISVSGLGTTQVVARSLLGPFAPAGVDAIAAVDAYTTAGILGVLLMRIVIGLACLPSVTRLLKARREP